MHIITYQLIVTIVTIVTIQVNKQLSKLLYDMPKLLTMTLFIMVLSVSMLFEIAMSKVRLYK